MSAVIEGTDKLGRKDPQRVPIGAAALRVLAALFVVLVALGALACADQDLSRARDAEEAGDIASAIDLYRAYLEKEPDDLAVLSLLAADLYLNGSFDEALPVQEKVVALDPEDAQTRIELGFNYLNHQDRRADAVRVLAEAAAIDPSAKNLTFFAQAQEVNKDMAEAETTLRRAIESDPKYAFSYMVLRDLLVKLGRTQDAAQVEEMARQQGVTIPSSE